MRKLIALLLTLCLILCACGKADNPDVSEEVAAENETEQVLPEMEGPESVENTEAPAEPQIVEIEITVDNWQDYFEIKEFLFFQNDEFGEFKEYSFHWCFVPKESIGTVTKSTVVLGYDYKMETRAFTVNPDTNAYEWGELSKDPAYESGSGTEAVSLLNSVYFYSNGAIDIYGAELKHMFGGDEYSERGFYYVFDVTRIEGTLTIQMD